jgi:hypothetical protein
MRINDRDSGMPIVRSTDQQPMACAPVRQPDWHVPIRTKADWESDMISFAGGDPFVRDMAIVVLVKCVLIGLLYWFVVIRTAERHVFATDTAVSSRIVDDDGHVDGESRDR